MGGLYNRDLFSGGGKSKIRDPAWTYSGEKFLVDLEMAVFTQCTYMVE